MGYPSGNKIQCHVSLTVRDTQEEKDTQKKRYENGERLAWCSHKLRRPRSADSHQKLKNARKNSSQEASQGMGPTNTLIFYFWSPELWDNKFLLFSAPHLMVVCCSSHKKLIWLVIRCSSHQGGLFSSIHAKFKNLFVSNSDVLKWKFHWLIAYLRIIL